MNDSGEERFTLRSKHALGLLPRCGGRARLQRNRSPSRDLRTLRTPRAQSIPAHPGGAVLTPELHGKAHWRERVQKGIEIAADGASEDVREKLAEWAKKGVERATGVVKGIWHAPERAGDALYDGVRSVLAGLNPALTRGDESAVPAVLHTRGRKTSSQTQRPVKPRVSLERDLLSVRLHSRNWAAGRQVVLLLFEDAALAPQATLSHWDPSKRLWIATFKSPAQPFVVFLARWRGLSLKE